MPPHTNDISRPSFGFVTYVLPSVAYAGAVFYAGLIRIGALPEVGFVATDKLLHALVFGGLGLLLSRAIHWLQPSATLARKLWLGCGGSSFLGMLLEVCQAFTAYRSADIFDWVADTVGALLALGLVFVFFAWHPRAHG